MSRIRLPHNEADETKRYSLTDPRSGADAYTAVYRWKYYDGTGPSIANALIALHERAGK